MLFRSRWEKDQKSASDVRAKEKADYTATARDYQESIDAINGAIAVLNKQAYDRKQAGSLVQVSALSGLSLIPKEAKQAINAFLQQDPDEGLAVSLRKPRATSSSPTASSRCSRSSTASSGPSCTSWRRR